MRMPSSLLGPGVPIMRARIIRMSDDGAAPATCCPADAIGLETKSSALIELDRAASAWRLVVNRLVALMGGTTGGDATAGCTDVSAALGSATERRYGDGTQSDAVAAAWQLRQRDS